MPTPDFFDTHVHLDRPPLRERLEPETAAAAAAGVRGFILPGVNRPAWPELLNTAGRVAGAFAAPGLHPQAAEQWSEAAGAELKAMLKHPKVAAIGEIGLDGLLDHPPMAIQEAAFRAQLRLAIEASMPVLIHCRKATGRVLRILGEEGAEQVGGIFHAFSGSVETAQRAIELGFAIGFGGVITYPNARRAPATLQAIPAEWVVLETDAPDIAPHPYRGKENRPEWLLLIASEVARLRGWTLEQTARITTANARRVLNLDE